MIGITELLKDTMFLILTLKQLGGGSQIDDTPPPPPPPCGFFKNLSSKVRVKPYFLWLLILS